MNLAITSNTSNIANSRRRRQRNVVSIGIILFNCNWYYLTVVPSLKVLNSILPTQLAENEFRI